MPPWAVAGVKRHNLGFYFRFDVRQECLHFFNIYLSQFVFHHKPGDGVNVTAKHLHSQPCPLYDRGTTPHKNVRYLEMAKILLGLEVGIIHIPHRLSRFCRVIRGFHRRRNQQRSKHTRSPPCPPLRHLVNGFARIPLDRGNLVNGQNGKIHL